MLYFIVSKSDAKPSGATTTFYYKIQASDKTFTAAPDVALYIDEVSHPIKYVRSKDAWRVDNPPEGHAKLFITAHGHEVAYDGS